ncbi:phosphatidate cytidylyltransferase [Lichenibacterium minor]|uniref:Phosphatidate cytidylyltransferase n=1 Tax=Lichenibacterium minor TaxID=2316528 RepID=A0A4V1RUZ9_9HYPH|nr:phosphatidate cytidylyltransferase [Lichenibacterium minor]RYC32914.1 phosphatidate cytidylyltransferase [Lichenibacterium minor]
MTNAGPGRDRTAPLPARIGGRVELLPRVLSAVVLAAVALALAWAGGPAFDLFWFAAALAVLWEWHGLVAAPRRGPLTLLGGAALAVAAALAARGDPGRAVLALLLGSAVTLLLARGARRGLAALGPLYAGVLAVATPVLRHSALDGAAIVFWLFAVVWGTDTLAFFGGRALRGPKLAPRLSPSKTWSGFVVGVGSGALLGLAVAPRPVEATLVFAAGLVGGALAQAGDLFESSLKRRCGAKDAGSLIPGHGGVMDRLDGFIAASALAAAVGLWRFGPDGVGAGLLQW